MKPARRELFPGRFGPTVRLFLTRRPWIRWLAICSIAVLVAVSVRSNLNDLEQTRASWAEQVRVPVATESAAPGEALRWTWKQLPVAAVAHGAATDMADHAVVRRHIGQGEVIRSDDLSSGAGPAAGADSGQVVVPISDPLVAHPPVGVAVAVYGDGLVLAADARIVQVEGDIVFVAVAADEAPMVAAAAQTRQASIGFLGPE